MSKYVSPRIATPASRWSEPVSSSSRGLKATQRGVAEIGSSISCAETLAELAAEGFQTAPGAMGEQIVIAGLDSATLIIGARLKLGLAVIEVGIPRTGCARFEMIQGKPKQAAKGRLGVMARVIASGEVSVGDGVEILPSE